MSLKKIILLFSCALSVTAFCKGKILDVCIFLDPTRDGKPSSVERRYDKCKIDPALTEASYAIRDNVDVLIISSSIMRVLGTYMKNVSPFKHKNVNEAAIEAESKEKNKLCDKKLGTTVGGVTITQENIDHFKKRQSNVEDSVKLIINNYSVYKIGPFAVLTNDKANVDLSGGYRIILPMSFSGDFSGNESIDVGLLLKILEDILPNRKIIYLLGHGKSSEELKKTKMDPLKFKPGKKAKIAALRYDEYSALIDGLGKSKPESKCIFLAITSCYAAGWNALTMHSALVNKSEEIFKKKEIQFPIALGVLTDATASSFEKDFKKLFETLHRIFTGVDPETGDAATTVAWTKKPFEKILIYLYGDKLRNFPSIRFPGLDTFFRAVNVDDKVAIITYPELIRHEMEFVKREKSYKQASWHQGMPVAVERTRKEEIEELENIYKHIRKLRSEGRDIPQKIKDELSKKIKKIRKQMKPLVFADKIAILIYPSVIDIPIEIKGNTKTKFISMISGPAHHYIGQLTVEEYNPDTSLTKFISPKSFFVEKLKDPFDQDKVSFLSPYVLNVNVTLPGEDKEIEKLYRDYQLGWFKCYKDADCVAITDEKDALDILKKILDITTPAREALWEATGGMESERKFRIKINESLRRICNKPDSWGLYPERRLKRTQRQFQVKKSIDKPVFFGEVIEYDRDKGSFIVLTKNRKKLIFDKKFFSFGTIKIGAEVEMTEDNGKFDIVGVSPAKKIEQQIAWKKRVGKVVEERERAFIVEISEPIFIKSRIAKKKKEINKIACSHRLIKKNMGGIKTGDEVTVEISPDLLGSIVDVKVD